MNFQRFSTRAVSAFAIAAACAAISYGQAKPRPRPVEAPIAPYTSIQPPHVNMTVAERNNLYCAGYVQNSPIDTGRTIVGAVDEQDGYLFSGNDVFYVNAGASSGVQVGDVLSVIRPRGQVKTRWTKKGHLGNYVQEVGSVEIIRVKQNVSVARVKTSCSSILLGDVVQPSQVRVSPIYTQRPALDLFADPSGKATGRLFMARDGVDMITRDNIVYVDLGAEDNVQVGDHLTIFRPLGTGNLFESNENESVSARSDGFESEQYHGGKFSNQTARKSGAQSRGKVVTTNRAKEGRPNDLRKVVGEMVVLNVKERTATAVITRTAQEIHPGDWVEVQ